MNLQSMKEEVLGLMESYFDQLIEERMDVIGQNGNEGIHYPPHDDYIMDNPTEEEKEANLKRYHERLNAMNERHKRLEDDDIYI